MAFAKSESPISVCSISANWWYPTFPSKLFSNKMFCCLLISLSRTASCSFSFWISKSFPFRMLSWTILCCSSSMFSSSSRPT